MSFKNILTKIPEELQNEIIEMDVFLKAFRPLKFKRTVDKRKINYVASDYGISYAILPLDSEPTQHFGWYYLYDKEAEKWYRKTDYFEETLIEIAKNNPSSAERIFNALNECTLCKDHPCSAILYKHNDKQKQACYGRTILSLSNDGFNDTKAFFQSLNALVGQE